MTSELTKEQKDQFEKLFYSFDTDKDGESKLSAIKLVNKEASLGDNTINQLIKHFHSRSFLSDETLFSPHEH